VNGSLGRVQIDKLHVDLPHRGVSPGTVKLAVRPDAIFIDEAADRSQAIAGQVKKASYLGTQVEYEVESPIGELFVVQYGRKEPIQPGTPVAITFAVQRGVAIIPGA
jgi:iron(III) transport system ATP-binding protein